jgi:4-amino-4-deoxy-L-arabinose transferase-like glycosyltransferase
VTETFSIPILACAIWAATVSTDRDRPLWPILSGLLIGLGVIYKQSAAIYWPALIVWVGWTAGLARARRFALWSLPGLFVAPVMALAWLWWTGALDWAWNSMARYIPAYLRIGHESPLTTLHHFAQEVWRRQAGERLDHRSDEVWALGSLGALIALVPAFRARTSASGRLASLGLIWLAAALLAVFINGPRFFSTYFMPPQIPLCLLAAWLFHEAIGIRPRWKLITGGALLALAAVFVVRSGSIGRAAQSISWDWQYISGRVDRLTYLDRFPPPRPSQAPRAFSSADNQRLADYVSAHTDPSERIFVFGMVAGTYYSSQRLPANRFLFAYPAVSNMGNYPEFRAETLSADLSRAQPRYIILQRSNGDSFSGWRASEAFKAPPIVALLDHYRAETEIGDFVLYRRLD